MNLKWKEGTNPAPSGSKSTISRFGECFRDGQYSLVSFLSAVLLLTVPLCPAICSSGKARPPVPHGVGVTAVVYFLPQGTGTKRGEGTGGEEIGTVQVLFKSQTKGEGKGRRKEKKRN